MLITKFLTGLFFLQFSTALSIARDFSGKYESLLKRVRKDKYMYMVVVECYELLKHILDILVVGDTERRYIMSFNQDQISFHHIKNLYVAILQS